MKRFAAVFAAVGRTALVLALAALAVGWTVLMGMGVDAPAPAGDGRTEAPAALGAGAHVTWVDEAAFPAITVYMAVNDAAGNPVYGLGQDDFALEEDGKPVQITGFTGAGSGSSSTLLVLDRSGSMGDQNKMAGAVAAAKSYVDMLAAGSDSVGLIAFDNSVYTPVPLGLVGDAQRAAVKRELDAIWPGGGTEFYAAVEQGIAALAGVSGRKVVLALTDGLDNSGQWGLNGAIRQATDAGVPIYAVGLGSDLDRGGLQALADGTGGQAFFSPGAAELAQLYASIAQGLRNEYALTYATLTPNQDGTQRALDVTVGGAAGGQSTSSSYGVGGILAPSLDWWVFLPTLLLLLVGLVALDRAPGAAKKTRARRRERAAVEQAETPAPHVAAETWTPPPGPPVAGSQNVRRPVQPPAVPADGAALVWVLPLPPGGGGVGNAPDNAALLAEAGVAPHHLRIAPVDGRFVVTDLAGGGATCVSFGGDPARLLPVVATNALKDGSLLQAGGTLLTFREAGAGAWLERRYPLGPTGLCAGSTPACSVRLPAAVEHAAAEALVTWDGARWVAEARAGGVQVSFGGDPAQLRPLAGRNALKSGSLVQVGGALLRLDC